ncbi:MAG: CRISPR system precrRNA processing endoribonuclease RAMP protein Cas6 [Candidatus Asgardarchaeum sp.]
MIKAIFEVMALSDGVIPAFTGHIVQGFFLGRLKRVSSELSKKLHDEQMIKPYAIFPLAPERKKRLVKAGMWRVRKGDICFFGYSILDPLLEEKIFSELVSESVGKINLANLTFAVTKINLKKKNFDQLLKEEAGYDEPPSKFSFIFHTPVQFKEKNKKYPIMLPIPELLFSNLARIWNTYSDVKVDLAEFKNWVSQNVFVRELKVVTREIDIGKAEKIVGFKGRVSFIAKSSDGYIRWLAVLTRFAEFSNVGNKRTRGLGVTTTNTYRKNQKTVSSK